MATIWKFVLEPGKDPMAPRGTNLISAGWDPKTGVCVWGEVPDESAPKEPIRLCIVGTGHNLPSDRGRFLGTVVMLDLGLVWHIYVEEER